MLQYMLLIYGWVYTIVRTELVYPFLPAMISYAI